MIVWLLETVLLTRAGRNRTSDGDWWCCCTRTLGVGGQHCGPRHSAGLGNACPVPRGAAGDSSIRDFTTD